MALQKKRTFTEGSDERETCHCSERNNSEQFRTSKKTTLTTKKTIELNSIQVKKDYSILQTNSNQYSSIHKWKLGTLNIRSGKEKLEGARIYGIKK